MNFKKISMVLSLAFAMLFIGTGCTRIEPGYEGIKVNMVGDNRGVEDITIVTGLVTYLPGKTMIIEFPVHMQGYVWTKDENEGSPNDESVGFQSSDKVEVDVDVEARLSFKQGRTPHIYAEHRQTPANIIKNYMRGKIREAFVRCGAGVEAEDLLGAGVITLQDCAKDYLIEMYGEDYAFDTIVVAGKPRIPKSYQDMINNTVAAKQEAIKAQAEVATKEAQARQMVATAEGRATAVLLEAEAQAKANRILAASITPTLVRYQAVEKWDGKQPQVVSDGGALLNLGTVGGKF